MKNLECGLLIVILILTELTIGIFSYFTTPQVIDLNHGHTTVGEDFTLECAVLANNPKIVIKWMTPLNFNAIENRVNIVTEVSNTSSLYEIRSLYTLSNTTLEDNSIYYCAAAEEESLKDAKYEYIWVPVYDIGERVIEFYKNHLIMDKANAEVTVYVKVHPKTQFQYFRWNDNANKSISPTTTSKFAINTTYSNRFANYKSVLKFKNISYEDFGNYTIAVETDGEKKSLVIPVNFTGKPSTSLSLAGLEDDRIIIKSIAAAFPQPNITWDFTECKNLYCYGKTVDKIGYEKAGNTSIEDFNSTENGLQTIAYVSLLPNTTGFLRSFGSNSYGNSSSAQFIYRPSLDFELFEPNIIVKNRSIIIEALRNETFEIVCAITKEHYYPEVRWFRDGKDLPLNDPRIPIKGFHEYQIKTIDALYSTISRLKLKVETADEGKYRCKAFRRNGTVETKAVQVTVSEKPSLKVASNMQNNTVLIKDGKSYMFYCNVDGYPTPFIQWFKDNNTIDSSDKLKIKDDNQTLVLSHANPNDNGTYSCEISNRFQKKIQVADLGVTPNEFDWLLVVIICMAIILSTVTVFVVIKHRRETNLKKALKEVGLANFEEGAIEYLNPNLPLDDQADLLPYDRKWEIPSENLVLGKQLGSGAFGVVVQADLVDFPKEKTKLIVAVKMVNKFAGQDCIRALASELKIMVHLGKHINIVNLIGACTKDVMKKKLLVVVEFCPFGNLHDYIIYNSRNFLDQRLKSNDEFDFNIGRNNNEKTATALQYASLSFSKSASSQDSESSQILNNYPKEPKHISSHDFILWGFQTAAGMDYLASRRVLHGDLAARNVLLSENNVVKISDFGLSRNMYDREIYKKTSNERLPVKWMAPESIEQHIFSTQSDVWSFGVLLWEFFSLAKTPYPGIEFDQTFCTKLICGMRMDKPQFATTKIYKLMLECWNCNPTARPTFADLTKRLGSILEEPVRNLYLEMNSPYEEMNSQSDGDSSQDYLSMMRPPTFDHIVSPFPCYTNFYPDKETEVDYCNINSDKETGVDYCNINSDKINDDEQINLQKIM